MRVVPSIHRVLTQIGTELETELSPAAGDDGALPRNPNPHPKSGQGDNFAVSRSHMRAGFAAVFVCARSSVSVYVCVGVRERQ